MSTLTWDWLTVEIIGALVVSSLLPVILRRQRTLDVTSNPGIPAALQRRVETAISLLLTLRREYALRVYYSIPFHLGALIVALFRRWWLFDWKISAGVELLAIAVVVWAWVSWVRLINPGSIAAMAGFLEKETAKLGPKT